MFVPFHDNVGCYQTFMTGIDAITVSGNREIYFNNAFLLSIWFLSQGRLFD